MITELHLRPLTLTLALLCALAANEASAAGDVNAGLIHGDTSIIFVDELGAAWVGVPGAIWRSPVDSWSWRPRVALRGSAVSISADATGESTDSLDAWQEAFELLVDELLEQKIDELRDELYSELSEDDGEFWDPHFIEELIDEALEELREEAELEAEAELGPAPESELESEDELYGDADDSDQSRARLNHIVQDPSVTGRVWAATSGGLLMIDDEGQRITHVSVGVGQEATDIRSLAWADGLLWVATAQRLVTYDPRTERVSPVETYTPSSELRFVAACQDAIWVVEQRRVLRSTSARRRSLGDRWEIETPPGLGEEGLTHLLCPSHADSELGALASSGAGVYARSADGHWRMLSQRGLPSTDVSMTFEDSRGRIWAATASGLAMLAESGWQPPGDQESGVPIRWIAETTWGSLIAATDQGLLEFGDELAEVDRDETLSDLERRWRREPSTSQLIEAAWSQAGLDEWNPTSWSRQRLAANFVPTRALIEYRSRNYSSRRNDRRDSMPTGDTSLSWLDNDNNYSEVSARVIWDFGTPASIGRDLERSSWDRTLVRHKRSLAARILRLQRQRREAMIVLETTRAAPTRRRLRASMNVLRLTSELDALTGYRFDLTHLLTQQPG